MPRVRRGLAVAVLLVASAVAVAEEAADVVILSSYRSRLGANARPRLLPHARVDFAAPVGTPVLAAADGVVSRLIDYEPGCGLGVVLSHPRFPRWTAYCHLTRAVVTTGQPVARGERIGLSGASGNSAGVPHVHLELCTTACASHRDGDLRGTQDPLGARGGLPRSAANVSRRPLHPHPAHRMPPVDEGRAPMNRVRGAPEGFFSALQR